MYVWGFCRRQNALRGSCKWLILGRDNREGKEKEYYKKSYVLAKYVG
jgi:hypothetical protein